MQLMGGNALLAGHHEEGSKQPLVQGDLAVLEHGTNGDAELLAALFAVVEAGAMSLALHLGNARRINVATVWANRTIGPTLGLQVLTGLVGIGENGMIEAHGCNSLCPL